MANCNDWFFHQTILKQWRKNLVAGVKKYRSARELNNGGWPMEAGGSEGGGGVLLEGQPVA